MTLQKLTTQFQAATCSLAALQSKKVWHKQNLVACFPTSCPLISGLQSIECWLSTVQYCISEQVTDQLVAYISTSLSAPRSATSVSCTHAWGVIAILAACSQQTHQCKAAVESFLALSSACTSNSKILPPALFLIGLRHATITPDQERHSLFESSLDHDLNGMQKRLWPSWTLIHIVATMLPRPASKLSRWKYAYAADFWHSSRRYKNTWTDEWRLNKEQNVQKRTNKWGQVPQRDFE